MLTSRGVAFFVVVCCVATIALFGTAAAQAPPPTAAPPATLPDVTDEDTEEASVRELDNIADPPTDEENVGDDGLEDPDEPEDEDELGNEEPEVEAPASAPGPDETEGPASPPEAQQGPEVVVDDEDIQNGGMGLSVSWSIVAGAALAFLGL